MAKKNIRDKRKQDLIFYVVMLAIPMLQFAIFYIGVNFNSFLLMFQKFDSTATDPWKRFVFLDGANIFSNFGKVIETIKDSNFKHLLTNSLISYVVSLVAGTGFAIIFSYYVYKKFPLHGLVKVVLFAPSIISGVVLAQTYNEFVNGVIQKLYNTISGETQEILISKYGTSTTFGLVLFYCIWVGFGGSILLYVGAMNNIPESVSEACQLDGANLFQELIYIVFPLIYPTFVTFMVVGVGGIFTNQMALYGFFGDGAASSLQTFGYYLFHQTKNAGFKDYPKVATMGLMMTAIAAPLTFLIKWLLEKYGPTTE